MDQVTMVGYSEPFKNSHTGRRMSNTRHGQILEQIFPSHHSRRTYGESISRNTESEKQEKIIEHIYVIPGPKYKSPP